jgi:hypothetical protein
MRVLFTATLFALPTTACAQQPDDAQDEADIPFSFVGPLLEDTATKDSSTDADDSGSSVLIPLSPAPKSVQADASEEMHKARDKAQDLLERLRDLHPEVVVQISRESADSFDAKLVSDASLKIKASESPRYEDTGAPAKDDARTSPSQVVQSPIELKPESSK